MELAPFPRWADDCCVVCPAQKLGPGAFDVVERPFHGQGFDDDGMRIDTRSNVPCCVHPWRLGVPPGAYASRGVPFPDPSRHSEAAVSQGRAPIGELDWPGVPHDTFVPPPEVLELPAQSQDLEAWMVALLRTAQPSALQSALGQAESRALERFSADLVLAALRRVLTVELPKLPSR